MTAAELVAEAGAAVAKLTDEGDQFHRRAVVGKPLAVHEHGWDRWAYSGDGGMSVSIRVEGQYLDRARFCARSRAEAETLARACRALLGAMTPPVPAMT